MATRALRYEVSTRDTPQQSLRAISRSVVLAHPQGGLRKQSLMITCSFVRQIRVDEPIDIMY